MTAAHFVTRRPYNLLTFWAQELMHAKSLPWTTSVPDLTLIARAVFLSERGQTRANTHQSYRRYWLPLSRISYRRRGSVVG